MQENAEYTLYIGHKYFRLANPVDSSALMLTTPEELDKRCLSRDYYRTCGKRDRKGFVMNKIQTFKERPVNYLVFDAEEVLNYLKAEGKYYDVTGKYQRNRYLDSRNK